MVELVPISTTPLPNRESHVRELKWPVPDRRAEIWSKALERYRPAVTAAHVREVVYTAPDWGRATARPHPGWSRMPTPPPISVADYRRLLAEVQAGQALPAEARAALEALLARHLWVGRDRHDAVAAVAAELASGTPAMERLRAAITVVANHRLFEEAVLLAPPDAAIDDATIARVVREAWDALAEPDSYIALTALRAKVAERLPTVAPARVTHHLRAIVHLAALPLGDAIEQGDLTWREVIPRDAPPS